MVTSVRKRSSRLERNGGSYQAMHVNRSSIPTEVFIQAGYKISGFIILYYILLLFIVLAGEVVFFFFL